jgi:hypothetical protein
MFAKFLMSILGAKFDLCATQVVIIIELLQPCLLSFATLMLARILLTSLRVSNLPLLYQQERWNLYQDCCSKSGVKAILLTYHKLGRFLCRKFTKVSFS